jgi:hypothetical protein
MTDSTVDDSTAVASDAKHSSTDRSTDAQGGFAGMIREQANVAWAETREKAKSTAAEQQKAVAASMGDLAGALHSAAGDLARKERNGISRLAEESASGLDRLSNKLRRKDFDATVSEAEAFARREPALFLCAAVAAGFLAVRFLKSSGGDAGPARMPAHAGEHAQSGSARTSAAPARTSP